MTSRHIHAHRLFGLTSAVALILTVACGPLAWAGVQSGGAPGDWLSRYAGARTVGLGGAFTAAADEPLGALWNPAGLSQMSQNQLTFETARLFEGTSINGLSFAMPAGRLPSFGVTLLSLSSGDIERTSEMNEPLGSFGESDFAFLFTGSKNLNPRLAVGANLKIARQSIEEFDATGFGGDVGLLYDVTPAVRLGISALNLGGPSLTLREVKEDFPTELRGGIAVRGLSDRALVTAELNQRSGPGTSLRGGTEFWIHPVMALRAGYHDGDVTGGFGITPSPGFQIDYGLQDHELGMMHRIGVSYRFGGFFACSDADPPVFSPVGQRPVTKFHLKSRTKADTQEWSLEVLDKFKNVVRRFSGKGTPPAHVVWDGKDEAGLPLPDGVYRYQLVVTDEEGRKLEAQPQKIEIATGGPRGTVPAIVG